MNKKAFKVLRINCPWYYVDLKYAASDRCSVTNKRYCRKEDCAIYYWLKLYENFS